MPVGAFLLLAHVFFPAGGECVSGMVAGSQSVDRYRAPELCGEVADEFPVCGLDFVDVGATVQIDDGRRRRVVCCSGAFSLHAVDIEKVSTNGSVGGGVAGLRAGRR
jgi:hypothetical protein